MANVAQNSFVVCPWPNGLGTCAAAFSAVKDCAALCPNANESFKYFTISAFVFNWGGPLSSLDSMGGLSPVTAPHNSKLVAATCLTSSANVFTVLYSLPGMLSETGVKLNLSSGMASAALTNSLSRRRICWSTADATLAGGAFGIDMGVAD